MGGDERSVCVEVIVTPEDAELAADRLWSLGARAVEERAGDDPGARTLSAGVPGELAATVLAGLEPSWPARIVEIDDGTWADAWRAHAVVVRAGRGIVVAPAWLPPPPGGDDDVVVAIDPGRAFGSGTHPSTRLVLAALEDLVGPGSLVLDVGCGSGVLSVAAALLSATRVVGVDIDPEAVRATMDNAQRNGVADRVEARLGDISAVPPEASFDVIAVNIGAAAIVATSAALRARLSRGGALVAAGFLAGAATSVTAAFSDLDAVDHRLDGPWAAVTLRARAE